MAEQEEVFIDKAWYDAQIDKATTDESASAGTPGIIFSWLVTEGEMAGKHLGDERWITVNSMARHQKEIMEALDYDIAKEDLDEIASLEGKQARVQCRIEEWPEGSKKFRAKVGRIRKKSEDGSDNLPPAHKIMKMFGREMKSQEEWDKDKKF